MRTSETTSAVFDAIVKAQAALPSVKKDKTAKIPTKSGGSFSYSYASLDTVIDHVHGALVENGLAVVQEPVGGVEIGHVGLTTRIIHRSGEWIEYGPVWLPGGGDAQAHGSAITYARRYALSAALGIAADEDDDGKSASKKPKASAAAPVGELGTSLPERVTPAEGAAATWEEQNERVKASGERVGHSDQGEGRSTQSSPGSSESGGDGAPAPAAPPDSDPTSELEELWAEASARDLTKARVVAILKKAQQPVVRWEDVDARQLTSILRPLREKENA